MNLKALWLHHPAEIITNLMVIRKNLCDKAKRFGCATGSLGESGLWLDVWNLEGTTGKVAFPQYG
jgi:hypothetical protein